MPPGPATPPPGAGDVVGALADQQGELAGLLEQRDDAGWRAPSRCEGWSVQDVVCHLAQTNEMAVASVRGDLPATLARLTEGLGAATGVDEGAELMVRAGRSASPAVVHRRWADSARDQVEAFRAADPHARLQWVAGELAAATLATTRLAETWIHTCDVAAADGTRPAPTDRLWHVARLAWRTLPHAFARQDRSLSGPVAFRLTGPDDSPWHLEPDGTAAVTVVSGPAEELCEVAARRTDPSATALVATGPDAEAVLALVRTWA
jgi:uncharacterized protein (TIGR03084 family)